MSDRWTWHGGGLRAAREHFGGGDWIDLSTGINPHPWPVPDQRFDWTALPDEADLRELEAIAAGYFGADPACVCAVPGTEIGLRLTGDLIAGPACHLVPSYRTHGEILSGSKPVSDAGRAAGATLVLANPNNPDGRIFDTDAVGTLLRERGSNGWLLIDEAFADTDPALSHAGLVEQQPRLVVFRSFGKFFGLAGVRLGFVLGPPALLAAVRSKLGAWPLSAAAIAIGKQAYGDNAWISATRARLTSGSAKLDAVLSRAGLVPRGSCPLFRLVEVDDARALFERLAASTILTRPFAENPRWLRIGLPPGDGALSRLERALCDG